MIVFACAGCKQNLRVDAVFAGQRVRCPRCGQVNVAPALTPEPSEPSSPLRATPALADTVASLPAPVDPSSAESATLSSQAPAQQQETTVAAPMAIPVAAPLASDLRGKLAGILAPPQRPDEIGRLGGYRVLKVLGAGGMGVVFLAEDVQLKRPVALKAMLPTLAEETTHRQRFLRKAQAAAAVEHDHVVPIFQVGQDRGVPFLAMPLLKGESLEARLRREGKLSLAEVVRIGREIAEGLAAAHERGLVHRDIKPGNVWLEGDKGRVKILDFGLARALEDGAPLTQPGAVLGTPAYMAPEQVNADRVDHRADLFSLGCVLYRLATGKLAFRGTDPLTTFTAVLTQQPPDPRQLNPDLPPTLADLIVRLLAKDPADRPPSARAVADELLDLAGERTEALPSPRTTGASASPLRSVAPADGWGWWSCWPCSAWRASRRPSPSIASTPIRASWSSRPTTTTSRWSSSRAARSSA